MSASDKPRRKTPDNSLVGDLESLRSLLDQEPEPETMEPSPTADEHEDDAAAVPVLDDMVQGSLAIDESPLHERQLTDPDTSVASFGDETIKTLLGDEWRESADRILSAARDAIENVASKWSPQQTTDLNRALRVRIDATLESWLEQMLQQRLDDLRSTLLDAIETEIAQFIAQLNEKDPDAE